MKTRITIVAACVMMCTTLFAQSTINKTIPLKGQKLVRFHFDYPQIIRVSTWEKNEISITGNVSINGGEQDNAFKVETTDESGNLYVKGSIQNLKDLPKRITIYEGGQKVVFQDKAALKKYQQEHPGSYERMSWGTDIDIEIEIKVPAGLATEIESVYGMVEVKQFNAPLQVEATYGGVDAALREAKIGQLTAETNYGEIFSNLDTKLKGDGTTKDFHTLVKAQPGKGFDYTFESKYGNVYLRKSEQ